MTVGEQVREQVEVSIEKMARRARAAALASARLDADQRRKALEAISNRAVEVPAAEKAVS